jgi:hypothetical protein
MAAMLLQAQGNGDSPAGLRLQRLCTELVCTLWCMHSEWLSITDDLQAITFASLQTTCCSFAPSDRTDHGHGGDADA